MSELKRRDNKGRLLQMGVRRVLSSWRLTKSRRNAAGEKAQTIFARTETGFAKIAYAKEIRWRYYSM